MSVLVVGMSHRSAPVALLEQLSMDDTVRDSTAQQLVDSPSLTEAMIVSTCNRLEVYAMTSSFHSGVNDVVEVLHDISGVDMETLRGYLYVRYADAAAEHMMVVVSGMDSMVVGEQQIIGQVRTAYQHAIEIGTVGPALHGLVQASLHTGKRVHTETNIDDAGASMVSFALDEALTQMGLPTDMASSPLKGKVALVLGAGAMASLAATHLGRLGVSTLIIANRTRERAERLADHARQAGVDAEVVDFDERVATLSRVDIAVSATGANTFTIEGADVADVPAGHALMLIDLSMPRDIDDAAAMRQEVSLVNIEKLHAISREDSGSDGAAQRIVNEELAAYSSAQRVKDVAPAVSALRRHAAELVESELDRLKSKVPGISEEDFGEVQRTVRRVVDKLLHQPTVRVKELAANSGTVSYDSALQELFGLSEALPERSVKVDVDELPDAEIVALGVTDVERATAALRKH
ncbi:glutamyl-tRNA reductase [Corynebacterium sp. SCR221107]|uniref:glutamyl-tRNA reductase n=1 Tax=Corynebacterium sp. SCR221107 TaxID=3017361 RepID=UPI0022EC1C90|nr:glutamyl-tRNA reductase [Corynebacterium sp. SCR221107]WBT09100.1 glutamyl-tRNA reductase [Corynebacterium sp. SCR221107]